MADTDERFSSVTGLPETADPALYDDAPSAGAGATSNNTTTQSSSSLGPNKHSSTQTQVNVNQHRPRTPSAPPSAMSSPVQSRDTSPARQPSTSSVSSSSRPPLSTSTSQPHAHQPAMAGPARKVASRSRKNSHTNDVSPHRGATSTSLSGTGTTPSAAAIQRALASASTPQLQPPAAADASRVQRPAKSNSAGASGDSTPHWPVSPRIKSPPPSANTHSRRNSLRGQPAPSQLPPRRPDGPVATQSAPNIVVESTDSPPQSRHGRNETQPSEPEDPETMSRRGTLRGQGGSAPSLETVQEASLPATPGFDLLNVQSANAPSKQISSDETVVAVPTEAAKAQEAKARESGSESGSNNKSEDRGRSTDQKKTTHTPRPAGLPSRNSFTGLVPGKSRSVTEPSKNMTVETETVRSVPQGVIGQPQGGAVQGRGEPSGTLRLKPSNETIRPKKEKRKTVRKAPSITSGTASSKADIFEAKVASAVDEADSSDSDETFVYESNPPDTHPRPSRHHSRTPSATSMASIVDHPRGGLRAIPGVVEGHRSVAGKRSMKFANNPYNNSNADDDGNDRYDGTIRGNHSRSSGSHSGFHHHIGRFGRNSNISNHLDDGSKSQHSRNRSVSGYTSRHGSQPGSPKFAGHSSRPSGHSHRKMGELSAYDMDGEGADDERTPLMGTVQRPRHRAMRSRASSNLRPYERYESRRRGCLRRFAGCFVLTIMVLLLAFGAVGFLFATTKPLYRVQVKEIQNVLASEQEIMLDLLVEAINPNIVAVSVEDMDVNIFAKSKHVGSEKFWREHPDGGSLGPIINPVVPRRSASAQSRKHDKRDDDPADPIEDPEGDSQTMLLGRIFHFDSPLNFDGDPLKRRPHYSIGELRLQKPGNKTEAGGTERWERVIQYPFELIVRGVLKYQLPLSSSTHTAPIGAVVAVHPEKGIQADGTMSVTQVWHARPGDEEEGDWDDWEGDWEHIELPPSSS
ncbi:putative phospholipid metabolism enzyme regulator [Phyllosticta citriasiana]|uniref:putative phospholipid metabolism enzyme regulator n=1 Tax=Phyllosticta citriasiana TaxID=595635 RepID=UPI0030FD2944